MKRNYGFNRPVEVPVWRPQLLPFLVAGALWAAIFALGAILVVR